jgi:DNA transformation protein and related proteins
MKKKAKTAAKSPRGKLKSMRVSMGFREFVLDQLGGIANLQPRAMFGGVGLYAGDTFFGIVAADSLYFKVDDKSRGDYQRAGSSPFAPYVDRPAMRMASYYAVPPDVLESAPALDKWARRAIAVARSAKRNASK